MSVEGTPVYTTKLFGVDQEKAPVVYLDIKDEVLDKLQPNDKLIEVDYFNKAGEKTSLRGLCESLKVKDGTDPVLNRQ